MLVQLLGFSHPRDLFEAGNFVDVFRRVWSFVASICFRSQEGFAAYLGTQAGMMAYASHLLNQTPGFVLDVRFFGDPDAGELRQHTCMHPDITGRLTHTSAFRCGYVRLWTIFCRRSVVVAAKFLVQLRFCSFSASLESIDRWHVRKFCVECWRRSAVFSAGQSNVFVKGRGYVR